MHTVLTPEELCESRANDDFGRAGPAHFAANAFAANGSPVYRYRFSYVQTAMRERMRMGPPHGGEIAFVFGTLTARPGTALSPRDQSASRMAQSYWVNFAKTGDPNGADLTVVSIRAPSNYTSPFRREPARPCSFPASPASRLPRASARSTSASSARCSGPTLWWSPRFRCRRCLVDCYWRPGRHPP